MARRQSQVLTCPNKCLRSIHYIIHKIAMLKRQVDKNPKVQNGQVTQGIMKYHDMLHKESYCSSYIAPYIKYAKDSLKASKD